MVPIESCRQLKVRPNLQTVAGPCKFGNVTTSIFESMDTHKLSGMDGMDFAGEIVLENPFLMLSGLIFTDLISKNIDRLSSIDFGDLTSKYYGQTIGKLVLQLMYRDMKVSDIHLCLNILIQKRHVFSI